MRYDPRTWGFKQARPKFPGVYFIVADRKHETRHPLNRVREGWEIAHVYWENDGFGIQEPTENGVWRIKTLGGLEYTWVKGAWLKGPIDPSVMLQERPAPQRAPGQKP